MMAAKNTQSCDPSVNGGARCSVFYTGNNAAQQNRNSPSHAQLI